MENIEKKDLNILKQLYLGNHLNEMEKERALKLLKLLKIQLKTLF
jgi:hypothetical protein